MRNFIVIALSVLSFISCRTITGKFTEKEIERIKSDFTIEELDYFTDVVFNSDFSNKNTKLKRWKKNIGVSMIGSYTSEDSIYISDVFKIINNNIEKIRIEYASENKADLKIHFIDYKEFSGFNENAVLAKNGYFNCKWNILEGIAEGYILINKELKGDGRKRVIKEEITQSLGLPADSYKYPSSIFYQLMSENYTYADIDIKLIQLLYNYNLPIGMTEQEFKDICLKDE